MDAIRNSHTFQIAHPHFYEHLSYISKDAVFHRRIEQLVPASWTVRARDIWCEANPPSLRHPSQGFKIHLSTVPWEASGLLDKVIAICVQNSTPFKALRCSRLLTWMNSKSANRGVSGKFIAIYPADDDATRLLLEELYLETKLLDGPYILSDRQYKDSKVIYYRYGSFVDRYRVLPTGARERLIQRPDTSFEIDARLPFFRLPAWVTDISPPDPPSNRGNDVLLNGRFQVDKALQFSNWGGIYKASDQLTGQTVIVKEARAFTGATLKGSRKIDATTLLLEEYQVLQRLDTVAATPTAISFFKEWEHAFLVQSCIQGIPALQFRALKDFSLSPLDGNLNRSKRFCSYFKRLAKTLITGIKAVHAAGVVHGDISPANVLIDEASLTPSFIDFGSARIMDADCATQLRGPGTPGFMRELRKPVTKRDDYYSLGILLLSFILPVERLNVYGPNIKRRFLRRLLKVSRLPAEVGRVINLLCAGKVEQALITLDGWKVLDVSRAKRLRITPRKRAHLRSGLENRKTLQVITSDLHGITDFLRSSADTNRDDRLWPCDYEALRSNPLSLAYGAAGPALFLCAETGGVDEYITKWIARQRISSGNCPPGLYVGTAGIAFAYLSLGDYERAKQFGDMSLGSTLLGTDQTMFHGAAGCGLLALELYCATKQQSYLDSAVRLGNQISTTAIRSDTGLYWSNSLDSHNHLGFGIGSAGIALYLLYLFLLTDEHRFLTLGQSVMDALLLKLRRQHGSAGFGRYEGDVATLPYSLHGTSGIGSVCIRYARHVKQKAYTEVAEKMAHGSFAYFTAMPGQFLGLSGIGEFFLDLWMITNKVEYKNMAMTMADSIHCYGVPHEYGLAFPGRRLERMSTDFAYGSSGIGMFFQRLLRPGPRLLYDLHFLSPATHV